MNMKFKEDEDQCTQLRNQSVQAYLEIFQNNLDVNKYIGGSIGIDPILYKGEEGGSRHSRDTPRFSH